MRSMRERGASDAAYETPHFTKDDSRERHEDGGYMERRGSRERHRDGG